MSFLTVGDNKYDMSLLAAEAITFVDAFAAKLRLDNPLPANTDLSNTEDEEAQQQVRISIGLQG